MPIFIESVRLSARDLAQAKERAISSAREISDALTRARQHRDPNLTKDALARLQQEMAREFRAAAQTDVENLRRSLENSRRYLIDTARENVRVADDPAALIRSEQKWRQVERQLDAGMELRDILKTADMDTALAIAEFGPSWVAASGYRPPTFQERVGAALAPDAVPAAVTSWMQRAVYDRIAQITPDERLAELLTAANTADVKFAAAAPYLDAAQSLVDTGAADMMAAGIASHVAEADAAPVAA
ncbi:hypothetical protein FBY40_1590 [Microbacterium sp. SLBN-154]|uniref:hypothetical protein n=1 Tax=Microbacterium sp. SLBN-154 TaxID=2768458 RepID=UPI001151DF12|nr:hypothetical protein [Microbacterium sp. SLBN-154]TQK19099.1 hypothetical protein FBY40_1590 [Microbacterium sp. SLBN-154]